MEIDRTYEEYRLLLFRYFNERSHLWNLEDAASNIYLSEKELKAAQEEYILAQDLFRDKCYGKEITFPVIEKNGKTYLKSKKVSTGIYECIKYFFSFKSYAEAMLELRKIFNENNLEVPEDEVLCCTRSEYEDTLLDIDWLRQKIQKEKRSLANLLETARIYELVNHIERK